MPNTAEVSLPTDHTTPPPDQKQGPASGGRWVVWAFRGLVGAVLVVILINGVLRIAGVGTGAAPAAPAEEETAEDFPVLEAGAYAAGFADVYLDTDPDQDRTELLGEYVGGESQARDMLPPAQVWEAGDVHVAEVAPADEHNAVVTLTLRLNGTPMSMDVPVYTDEDGMAITGAPALLPSEEHASVPEATRIDHDTDTAEDLTPVVEGFLGAYSGEDEEAEHLDRYVEPGREVTPLPPGMVELVDVRDVLAPAASGDEPRQVQATVVWNVLPPEGEEDEDADETEDEGPRQITQVYALTMVQDASSWYVRDVAGTPAATN